MHHLCTTTADSPMFEPTANTMKPTTAMNDQEDCGDFQILVSTRVVGNEVIPVLFSSEINLISPPPRRHPGFFGLESWDMAGDGPTDSPSARGRGRGRRQERREGLRCLRFLLPHAILIGGYLLYLALGGVVFSYLESPYYSQLSAEEHAKMLEALHTKEVILEAYLNASMGITKMEDATNITALLDSLINAIDHPDWKAGRRKSLLEGRTWSFPSAMLFSMTTITTIGYGDIVPETMTGQAFCVVYSVIGVPLSFYLLADIGQVLAVAFIYLVRWCREKFCRESASTRRRRMRARMVGRPSRQAADGTGSRGISRDRRHGTMPNVTMRHMQSVRFHVGGNGAGDERPKTERAETGNSLSGEGGGDVGGEMAIELNDISEHCNGGTTHSSDQSTNSYKTTVTTVTTMLDEKKGDERTVDEIKVDEKKLPMEKSDTIVDVVADDDADGDVDYSNDYHENEVSITIVIVTLTCYVCISAYAFSLVEGWHYGKAFYFTFITLTTIGFGDVIPEQQYSASRFLLCLLFTLVGLAVTSMCIALVQDRLCRAGRTFVAYLDRRTRGRREDGEVEGEEHEAEKGGAGKHGVERDPSKPRSRVG